MSDFVEARKTLVSWVKSTLSGEVLKDGILVEPNPLNRYTTGILYPMGAEQETEDSDIDEGGSSESLRYQPPSSLGFSFYVDASLKSIRVFYRADKFKKISQPTEKARWKKSSLVDDSGEELNIDIECSTKTLVMDDCARIDVTVRRKGQGRIVTVTLSNMLPKPDVGTAERIELAQNSLFETELRCFLPRTAVQDYPRVNPSLLSDEERELELRYKDEKIYAIGHGVAADWTDEGEDIEIYSDFMPMVEVPQVTANVASDQQASLAFNSLSRIEHDPQVFDHLSSFIESYHHWIVDQESLAATEMEEECKTANRLIQRMKFARRRMESGISILRDDVRAQKAFASTNKAMQMQMELNGVAPPDSAYAWRPFQLAFVLMTIDSSINEDSDDRDLVDLIWFPTGGGKTEAYLGLMAFTFAYRRLRYGSSGGGTTAIMRYTLRLLTSQQFVRACKVISALELLRRDDTALGKEPFSVGLWLGGESSPNNYIAAVDQKEKRNFSKFILSNCPWCSDPFDQDNYVATNEGFHFHCTNRECDFGADEANKLPYNVVDEALYENPPSLLIATVDKFARLPWEERATAFFGGNINRPPELIIQDELHLISGALGSIVGLYEVGFESILTSRGVYPKFVASTATVRQAKEQVKALFGRDMAVFPPVGLRQNDSYFAKQVPLTEKPGRIYVGYMAFGRSRQHSMEDLAGALVAAPNILFSSDEGLKDAWWTQLVYHGSLKSVGNSRTNFQSGVPRVSQRITESEFLRRAEDIAPGIADRIGFSKKTPSEEWKSRSKTERFSDENDLYNLFDSLFPLRSLDKIKSLTSTQTADENAAVFDALNNRLGNDNCVDAALATNMVSVGLDVSRLAAMIINGQPLTTAEYIQASSRVGRGSVPGVVFTNYYKTQARSLSHYENFRAYHRSFYRYVEPSSLTPFTEQVRNRALHASFVTAIRHGEHGLLKNIGAEKFDSNDPNVKKIIREFKKRTGVALKVSGPEKHHQRKMLDATIEHLDELIAEWSEEVATTTNLRYSATDKSANSLLVSFDNSHTRAGLWKTLNSMRNVERTALLKLDQELD